MDNQVDGPSTEQHVSGDKDEQAAKADQEAAGIADILKQEMEEDASAGICSNGPSMNRYRQLLQGQDDASDSGSAEGLPRRVGSPIDSLLSVPDDSPSVQGSIASSAGSSLLPPVASRPRVGSPTPSFRPFDRRFQSRISSSSLLGQRPSSPAYLFGHARATSGSSHLFSDAGEAEAGSAPWEVVRWARLNKLNSQAFSEAGKRNFGSATCIAVSASSIVLGSSKGIILIFDYNQNLKTIIGPGTKGELACFCFSEESPTDIVTAVESGPITAIAISADHTTIAGGHASGNIFTWDVGRASRPFLSIAHLDGGQLQKRTEDGHLPNMAITHLGFLGTRHTALVSADDRGMAFSHLATRGTGALGRRVKTVRILGRYPDAPGATNKPVRASTVLGFAALPLGNVERGTDSMGLTAMLTPYLLVVVSTTPIAQTQHKSARPNDVEAHSAVSGCLAWFPAVKLKVADAGTGSSISKVKLVYCWSNVLTVLDVDELAADDKDKPPSLTFKARSRWRCDEAIVAVQWLGRSVLTVLTITQRLVVVEDGSMRVMEAFDLLHKHIYHADLFSKPLHGLVEQAQAQAQAQARARARARAEAETEAQEEEEQGWMHGVVADAFYMSLKAHKGRLFLLGFNEVSIGALSNWADRLVALMEKGDYVGAIRLATCYYTGEADKLTVGLPEDARSRHEMVQTKLMEMMSASLKYAFGQRQKSKALVPDSQLQDLAATCFVACQTVGDSDFLFNDMYEWYEDGEVAGIFLETLEPYLLQQTITSVPPTVVKALARHFLAQGWESRLEEMICHMDVATVDIDQITQLCKQHRLYDALIYVWTQALHDYTSPLMELLTLLVPAVQDGDYVSVRDDESLAVNALKMFPYLSYTLTGRVYPSGEWMDDGVASQAKADIYYFLFSGKAMAWPGGNAEPLRTRPMHNQEPSFPYLRMMLKYDAPSFLSALNEAFEDSFLNESQDKQLPGTLTRQPGEQQMSGVTVDRQYVVSILLQIMTPDDFATTDTIYLDMFIARNLAKFPQYLLLPGSTLGKVLTGLCHYPGPDLADDAELSAEYILSVYQPPDLSSMMPLFHAAGFYRILKEIYRREKAYSKLVETYLEDGQDQDQVFDCIADCLRPQTGSRERQHVQDVIRQHSRALVELDATRAAQTIDRHAADLHRHVVESLPEGSALRYRYLNALLEADSAPGPRAGGLDRDFMEQYVQLMCQYDPAHVSDYVGLVQATDLRLEQVLPAMEESGAIDAAVVLMAREGQVQDAMERLTQHLHTLELALHALLTASQGHREGVEVQKSAEEVLKGLQKYTHVGIWLCQGQTKLSTRLNAPPVTATADELAPDELLWLRLIETTVQITRRLASVVGREASEGEASESGTERLVGLLRSLVQHTFTALLSATSSGERVPSPLPSLPSAPAGVGGSMTFPRILRVFLTRAATACPNLADVRAVLTSIFSAYAYEESILALSYRLLQQQLFVDVDQAVRLRQRGWRPRGSTCEACGRRLWGKGVSGNVFDAWEERQASEEARRKTGRGLGSARARAETAVVGRDGLATGAGRSDAGYGSRAKGKGAEVPSWSDGRREPARASPDGRTSQQQQPDDVGVGTEPGPGEQRSLGRLVVLACRHIYHQTCLDLLLQASEGGEQQPGRDTVDDGLGRSRVYTCPIDG